MTFKTEKIKAVIFDMDGVLVDTEKYYMECTSNWVQLVTQRPVPKEAFLEAVGATGDTRWKIVRSFLGSEWTRERYRKEYLAFMQRNPINYQKAMFPGIRQVIEGIRRRGIRTACATSSPLEKAMDMLKCCDMLDSFEVLMTFNDIANPKPHPEIYLTTLNKLGLDAEDVIVVEDSEIGIAAAKAAGLFVAARHEDRFPTDQSRADVVFEDYFQLAELIQMREVEC